MLSVHQEPSWILVHVIKIPTFIPIRFPTEQIQYIFGWLENRQKFSPKNSIPGGDGNLLKWLFHELG